LLRTFTGSLMMPHKYAKTEPGWSQNRVVEMTPKPMLADVTQNEDTALLGFTQGLGAPDKPFGLRDIPWSAWSRTLGFWLPLILVLWIGLIGMAVVLHRQWSVHEHLPYPIAQFANSLLPAPGEGKSVTRRALQNTLEFAAAFPGLFVQNEQHPPAQSSPEVARHNSHNTIQRAKEFLSSFGSGRIQSFDIFLVQ